MAVRACEYRTFPPSPTGRDVLAICSFRFTRLHHCELTGQVNTTSGPVQTQRQTHLRDLSPLKMPHRPNMASTAQTHDSSKWEQFEQCVYANTAWGMLAISRCCLEHAATLYKWRSCSLSFDEHKQSSRYPQMKGKLLEFKQERKQYHHTQCSSSQNTPAICLLLLLSIQMYIAIFFVYASYFFCLDFLSGKCPRCSLRSWKIWRISVCAKQTCSSLNRLQVSTYSR